MTNRPAPWTLRCVDGPMLGRTLPLPAGRCLLGSTVDCDLLIAGTGVRQHHARLVVGEVAVAIEPVGDAPLRLNGEPVGDARRGLVAGDIVALGDTAFELAVAATASPSIEDADFLAGPRGPAPAVPVRRDRRLWGTFGAGFVASLLVVWWALCPGTPAAAARDDGGARLDRVLADYPEVQLVAAADGRTRVTGFVESSLRLQALQRELAPLGARAEVRVQVVEALVDQVRRFLSEPALAVNYVGKGRLVVSGATENAALQEKVKRLGEDLHPAVLVSDKVQYKPAPAAAPVRTDTQALWDRWQELLPARIVSMSEGPDGVRHIQLANGERYYEGALLKSGARLDLVKPEDLVLAPERAP